MTNAYEAVIITAKGEGHHGANPTNNQYENEGENRDRGDSGTLDGQARN